MLHLIDLQLSESLYLRSFLMVIYGLMVLIGLQLIPLEQWLGDVFAVVKCFLPGVEPFA